MNNIATIILAAGKGTRMKKNDGNKVVIPFHGKPLIVWAVDIAYSYSPRIVIVVGVLAGHKRHVLTNHNFGFFIVQR